MSREFKPMVFENWTPCRLPGVYRKSGQFVLKLQLIVVDMRIKFREITSR
jgi:hypothetical protein